MLYMVECSFTDPDREAAWNAHYSGPKLDTVLGIPGFFRSQRFVDVDGRVPAYLAIHAVESSSLFDSPSYSGKGGGSFHEWQPFIADWRRNVFSGLDVLEEVGEDERLLVVDAEPASVRGVGVPFRSLAVAALDRSVPVRNLATVPAGEAVSEARRRLGDRVRVFRPITEQRRAAA